ncbi:MBL fold metallo-hydrolase [bacterium]|nr:MBL fold metallo-hydrolase [bacterium]
MDIRFHNAVREVTGTMHLLTVAGKRILLDCGLSQGRRAEADRKNRNFPFDPASIDALILSHAHIDHSGNIPQLVKQGYMGPIFSTHATYDLASIMLRDSAHIQKKDAEFLNKRARKGGSPPIPPLYSMQDAEKALRQFVGMGYERTFLVTPEVRATFFDAGHILGSAVVQIDASENGRPSRIVFTGDLGRANLPLLRDPVRLTEADVFITESTYGNKVHDEILDMEEELRDVVRRTMDRGGKIIVPSFSVGRTQEIVYFLHKLINEGALPELPIFVDSPLSISATEVFRMHSELFDEETQEAFLDRRVDPFGFHRLRYVQSAAESKTLNSIRESCVIISASGMCEAGRILHHLANNVSDPKNSVLVVSFMAANTLGRRIVERQPVLKILGETHPLRAEVATLNGFSAHADRNALLEYAGGLNRARLRQVFVVHGETPQSEALVSGLQDQGIENVLIPEEGKAYTL